jgi:hypothetical protein
MQRNNTIHLSLGFMALLLAACGSGPKTAGIEGSGVVTPASGVVAIGAITQFGSIFVNGTEYALTGANIQIDGQMAAESDLKLGQVVTVIASDTTARTAKSVAVSIAVAGLISAVDPTNNRFTVLGQTIAIDAATQIAGKIDAQALGGLAVGNDVEITGFADSSAALFARSIQPRRQATPLRVTGRVTHLDSATHRMQINGETVDYTTASLTGFSGHSLDSATVQISGDLVDSSGALHATTVAYVDARIPGAAGDKADLQGWVTRFVSETDFDVDGHPMTTTTATVMEGPWDKNVSVVRLDAFVHVTGTVIAGGVVQASEITTNNSIALGAQIYGIDAGHLWSTGGWGVTPCDLVDTAFSVDGVPASWQDIHLGDRATVYGYFNKQWFNNPQQKCYVVEVQHTLIGRIESVDAAAAALVVNGQRVWMSPNMFLFDRPGAYWNANGVASAGEASAVLHVGALIAVSGDISEQGDIVALGISSAVASQGYRVTGFARDVDPNQKHLRLGGVLVDYAGANVDGFAGGQPVEGDRVTMIAKDTPVGGAQVATGIKYAGGAVRGETLNFVTLGGLITRLTSNQNFAIDGPGSQPLPNPPTPGNGLERNICDPAKLHTDLRTTLVAVGGSGIDLPRQVFHLCPPGRHYDAYESLPDVPYGGGTAIVVPIEAIDTAKYSLQARGTSFGLNPGATITFAQNDGGTIHTLPLRMQDLHIGDLVRLELTRSSGTLALIDSLWAGPAIADSQDQVQGTILTVSEPDVTVSGFTIHTTSATTFTFKYWEELTSCHMATGIAADFWSRGSSINGGLNGPLLIIAKGSLVGAVLEATSVDIAPRNAECRT